jgi:lysyl-tRNA synthetase class I
VHVYFYFLIEYIFRKKLGNMMAMIEVERKPERKKKQSPMAVISTDQHRVEMAPVLKVAYLACVTIPCRRECLSLMLTLGLKHKLTGRGGETYNRN